MKDALKFNLRMPMKLMEQAKAESEAMGISLNAYVLLALQNFVPWTKAQRRRWRDQPPSGVREVADALQAAPPVAGRAAAKPLLQQVARVGRNDPCPCGSGKKAKHCCPEMC